MTKANKKARKDKPRPKLVGWLSNDTDEIERRRVRGAEESFQFEPEPRGYDFFADFRVQSATGQSYLVEIRSLAEPINSCACPDHRVNQLGTCKHVEAVLHRLQHRRKRAFKAAALAGGPRIEIFLDRRDDRVRVIWPSAHAGGSRARAVLEPFFTADGSLRGDALDDLPALQRAVAASHPNSRRKIRISAELGYWLEALDRRAQQRRRRQHFEAELTAGRASLDLVKHPLYPYQQEGMLHLAFTARALLADEMGLGKTVQAVAACALLRNIAGIKRVLVVSPASLKGEWQDQIAKFTDLDTHIVQGPRHQRLRQYGEPAFFNLANYEQIRPDVAEINSILKPDVIILDEAQRIKNWQTKTAKAIKLLDSPYAFVLTGTPVENRIDEIYSIVQFLDPAIFGPLFRFNRDYYKLDADGRAIGYKNLKQLHSRLRPVMLRRRKDDVEGQLPPRTVNTYLVAMHPEQRLRYEEYEFKAARLAHAARKRPLSKEEMDRLQQYLACMRMLCDTPYILDQECRVSPKLDELGSIIQELSADGDHKLIIFSEWLRMLDLVRELLDENGLDYAWHTGQVPQDKRRQEIRRFREDEHCRVFLSTDSGAVGLNLQVADVVINLDMPWNPAKLEQRIARAWRKKQKRPVQVINLVTEDSIEHRMLGLLAQKQALAEGIVDGEGDSDMALPSGRAAFLERIGSLFGEQAGGPSGDRAAEVPPVDPSAHLTEALLSQWQDRIELLQSHGEPDATLVTVVVDAVDEGLRQKVAEQLARQFPDKTPQLTLIDKAAHAAIQQLIQAGVLQLSGESRTLYAAPVEIQEDPGVARLREALSLMAAAQKKQRMAQVLAQGDFALEALAPLRDAVETALRALLCWKGQVTTEDAEISLIDQVLVRPDLLAEDVLPLIARLRAAGSVESEQVDQLLEQGDALVAEAAASLESNGRMPIV